MFYKIFLKLILLYVLNCVLMVYVIKSSIVIKYVHIEVMYILYRDVPSLLNTLCSNWPLYPTGDPDPGVYPALTCDIHACFRGLGISHYRSSVGREAEKRFKFSIACRHPGGYMPRIRSSIQYPLLIDWGNVMYRHIQYGSFYVTITMKLKHTRATYLHEMYK